MAHISDDNTVSNSSVFDWGMNKDGSNRSLQGDSSTKGEPSSRYDPKAMSRIVDINDLVDDSGNDSDGDDNIMGHNISAGAISSSRSPKNKKRKNSAKGGALGYGMGGIGSLKCRQVIILVALVAIIVGASVAIGYAVTSSEPNGAPTQNLNGSRKEQKLLEQAERIVLACAESHLDENMSECQKLCKKNMCCFESGDYSCKEDERKNCAVYAGCANLVEGIPLGAAKEDEE